MSVVCVGITGGLVGHSIVLVLPHFLRRAFIVHCGSHPYFNKRVTSLLLDLEHNSYSYVVVWCLNNKGALFINLMKHYNEYLIKH